MSCTVCFNLGVSSATQLSKYLNFRTLEETKTNHVFETYKNYLDKILIQEELSDETDDQALYEACCNVETQIQEDNIDYGEGGESSSIDDLGLSQYIADMWDED